GAPINVRAKVCLEAIGRLFLPLQARSRQYAAARTTTPIVAGHRATSLPRNRRRLLGHADWRTV
ncbi:MAG TPA: hypothetical protein VFX76_08425, partial [Roseiflexaceae bacterium]|nr:hypothetical protein [Roseiflexaceae bacterium]